jgi:cell division protein FtsL
MSRLLKSTTLKPWLSLGLILLSFFTMVFMQMETRRMGYVVWKQIRELKSVSDQERVLVIQYAKMNRPERLQELAVHKLTLSEINDKQVIHMTGDRVAVR